MSGVKIGDEAPHFTAEGTGSRTYSLEDYRGRTVVLIFYPGDATPVCTEQLESYDADFGKFEALNAVVLAISPQDVESHEAFSAKHGGFAFPLLYDADKEIGKAYGVLGPIGFYRRSAFVVDAHGVIRYAHRATAGLGYVKLETLIDVLRTLDR